MAKEKPAQPDAEDFYAINEDFVAFKHDEFEEVEIRVYNQPTKIAAAKIVRQFVAWLQGKAEGRI